MSSSDKIIDRLAMPQSTIDAMAKAVPTDVVQAIVGDHYRRAAPTPPKPERGDRDDGVPTVFKRADPPIPPGFVRPLTGEALERWLVESETANVVWDYDPFANWRLR